MRRHPELHPLSRGHQPLLMHARDLRWRATYLERGDAGLGTTAWPAFRSWARMALEPHLVAEEEHLLPRLGKHPRLTEAIDADRSLRRELRDAVAHHAEESASALRAVADALEGHARHCERVLFPAVEEVLGDDGLSGLADAIGVHQI